MDNIDKGDQIKAGAQGMPAGTQGAGMTTNTIRERSPNVPAQRPNGLSDVEWQEQQALQRQPTGTMVLDADEDDGTPDALLNKGGVSKGFDVAGLGSASST